jgi:predicted alpha/beta superfamily hydrolase
MCKIETFNVTIPYTGLERRVWVYLPSGYSKSEKRYPVLYMHDGQNLFDTSTSYAGVIWDIHSSIEFSMVKGKTEGVIVVAMDNASIDGHEKVGRLDEYSPWINSEIKNSMVSMEISRDVGGYGAKYSKYMVKGLKPLIDSKYRTLTDRDNTGVAGSSLGGLISLYMALEYEDVFSKVGAFSTSVWFAENELIKLIHDHSPEAPIKWYLDVGTKETSDNKIADFNEIYIKGTMEVYESLLQVGVKEENIKLVVDEGAPHNEESWARRFPNAFNWMFS